MHLQLLGLKNMSGVLLSLTEDQVYYRSDLGNNFFDLLTEAPLPVPKSRSASKICSMQHVQKNLDTYNFDNKIQNLEMFVIFGWV